MPFFIPGKTKCAICKNSIENQYEAATLPYISPKVSDTLSKLGRQFVHRYCWKNWKDAKIYADAAYDLVNSEPKFDSSLKTIFMNKNLTVVWVEALNIYQLQDFDLLVTLDIPSDICCEMTNFLKLALMNHVVSEQMQIGQNLLEVKLIDVGLEIIVHDSYRIYDRFLVSPSRKNYWLQAFREIQYRENCLNKSIERWLQS